MATQAAPSQFPSHLCSGLKAGQAGGCLGKASPRLAKPAAVGSPPVCSPEPRVLAGRCSSSPALAVTGTSGLGQHSSFPGMEGQQGQVPSRILALLASSTRRDTAAAAGIRRRNPPGGSKDARRGAQGEPVPQPKRCPISTSSPSFPHCWHILPGRHGLCSHPVGTREALRRERAEKPKHRLAQMLHTG